MQTNSVLYDNTTELDREFHRKVRLITFSTRRYMSKLSIWDKFSFECHSIARAISMEVPELKLVSGCYYGLEWSNTREVRLVECDHSWLVTPDKAILDPYPVGFVTDDVVLVVANGVYTPFGQGLYRPDEKISPDINIKEIWRKSQVIFQFIQEAKKLRPKGQW